MKQKNKKKKIIAFAGAVLTFGVFQSSSVSDNGCKTSTDEYSVVQIIQMCSDQHHSNETGVELLSDVSLVASFDDEKRAISLIESVSSNDDFDDSELNDSISLMLSDVGFILSLINYIEINKNDDLLILLTRMYLNLVSNRSELVIGRIIETFLESNNVSIVSFGIDVLSLHISYPECRKFLSREFSHPFLKKKMSLLLSEALF